MQVRTAARDVLEDQAGRAGLADPRFDLALAATGRPLPACGQPLVIEGVDTRYPSRMRFVASCADTPGWRQEVVVRATVSAEVLVASAAVPAGQALAANDVALQRRDITNTPDALSDLGAAGLSSRRSLRPGDVLRRSQLVQAVLVRRGEAVRIVARRGSVEVTVAGEALDAGTAGATVRVRNAGNGSVIQARVTGVGTVEPAEISANTPSPR